MNEIGLGLYDIIIACIYIIFVIGIGLYVARKQKGSTDYFLAGRKLTWPLIGFSLFASNMNGSSFVGLAGSGYEDGIAVFNYEWAAAVILVFFVFFILPFYLHSRVYTMPEFLEKRFDRRSRYLFSIFTLLSNMFIDMAAALYAGGLVVILLFPSIELWEAVVILALLSGIYTIVGGLSAVVITDTVQAIILIIGSILIAWLSFNEIGSWQSVLDASERHLGEYGMSLIRPDSDPFIPWTGLISGVFIIGFYFWSTNQFMVQRVLGARSLDHGRWGSLFAGLLKLPILFLMVLPGSFALILYPNLPSSDLAFPTLAFDLLPIGLRGIVLAALIAAIMSSVDSTLNSASTLFTMDFVNTLRPNTPTKYLVRYGKISTFFFMLIAILWAPQIQYFENLWTYLQSTLAYMTPPILVCFLSGIFWKRSTKNGAFITLASGLTIGLLLLLFSQLPPWHYLHISWHYLHISFFIFVFCLLIMIIVSFFTEKPDINSIKDLVWTPDFYRRETMALKSVVWYQNYRIQSILLLVITGILVGFFW